MTWFRPTGSRRAEARKQLPDLRAELAQLARREGVPTALLIALVFFVLTAGLMLMRSEVLPYRPGQHVAQDIVARVDFTYLDKDRLLRAKQDARDRVTRVYRPHEKAWERLQGKLLELPDRVAARSVADAVAPIHRFLDAPPTAPVTAVDRGKRLPPGFPTLDPHDAERLMDLTERLLR